MLTDIKKCSSIQSFRENARIKSNTFTYSKQSSSWWEYYVWVTFELSWTACIFVAANFWIFIMGIGCKASPKDCPPMTIYSWNAHLVNVVLINIDLVLNRFVLIYIYKLRFNDINIPMKITI